MLLRCGSIRNGGLSPRVVPKDYDQRILIPGGGTRPGNIVLAARARLAVLDFWLADTSERCSEQCWDGGPGPGTQFLLYYYKNDGFSRVSPTIPKT